MPWRPSANPQLTTRNGSRSAGTENASGVSGMATRKPAKTLSPSRRRRRSKRTIDTSQVCPRSTWLTHVRSGFEQRAGERPSLPNLVLYAVEVLLTAPTASSRSSSGCGYRPRRALPSRERGSDAAAVATAEGHVLKRGRLVSDQKPIGLEPVWGWPV